MHQLHLRPSRTHESVSDYHSLAELADKFLSQGRTRKCRTHAEAIRASILEHGDPLGDMYARIIAPDARRQYGATFTPPSVVQFMLSWAKSRCENFSRIVDPGAGSGRFALAAARLFPESEIIAVEKEPHIAHLLKANVAAAGIRDRIRVIVQDYRTLELPKISARTLFVGNPPYVRHHHLGASWKRWYAEGLKAYNVTGSRLAGLHLHFLLKTRQLAEPGDYGCFITAAEWLDVNYGSPLRAMLTNGMGGQALYLVDKTIKVFGDALTSSVILCFRVGATPNTLTMRHIRSLEELNDLGGGRRISLSRVQVSDKWSQLTYRRNGKRAKTIELGDLFEVHRGQVTGMNAVWVEGNESHQLPSQYLIPTVTEATELINAPNCRLLTTAGLKRVVSLPADLSAIDAGDLDRINSFLSWAKSQGAHGTYVARHRRPWWRVSLPRPAPILMTYMARRPPVFVRNMCGAHIINIAHGLYPRVPLTEGDLDLIIQWLNTNVCMSSGRTYAGGLTKFEPREVMRLRMPPLDVLREP